jgi:hypothetical protein
MVPKDTLALAAVGHTDNAFVVQNQNCNACTLRHCLAFAQTSELCVSDYMFGIIIHGIVQASFLLNNGKMRLLLLHIVGLYAVKEI